jgi:NitT/TauT family transport system substrate-binding protein
MKMKSILIMLLLITVVGVNTSFGEDKKIKVGILPTSSMLPLFLAQERGWYKEAGLNVELIKMRGGATILPAIVGGSIDMGYSNAISIILARSAGLGIQILTNHVNEGYTKKAGEPGGYATSSSGILVLKESGIKGPKDLEGKKVAVNAIKNIDWMAVWEWMEKNGADPKKVTWVEVGFPKMIPALMGKKVDAVEATEPFKTILRSKGASLVVNTLHDLRPGLTLACFVAKEEWINKNPQAAEGFVSATAKAQQYLNTHPEERNQLVTKYTKVSLGLAKKMTWHNWQSSVDMDSMRLWIKLSQKHKLLKKAPTLEELISKTAR